MSQAVERRRLKRLSKFEEAARVRGFNVIAGVDEAGRGPLAGPVVAAACILPENIFLKGANDSKKLSPKQCFDLFNRITQNPDIVYGVGIIESQIIDQINILKASLEAMLIAIARLSSQPDYLLVDGPHLPKTPIPGEGIIEGDARSLSIAAASIIAKETRDQIMVHYHTLWPCYRFDQHKGYGTEQHLEALSRFGPCPIHRRSFQPVKQLCG